MAKKYKVVFDELKLVPGGSISVLSDIGTVGTAKTVDDEIAINENNTWDLRKVHIGDVYATVDSDEANEYYKNSVNKIVDANKAQYYESALDSNFPITVSKSFTESINPFLSYIKSGIEKRENETFIFDTSENSKVWTTDSDDAKDADALSRLAQCKNVKFTDTVKSIHSSIIYGVYAGEDVVNSIFSGNHYIGGTLNKLNMQCDSSDKAVRCHIYGEVNEVSISPQGSSCLYFYNNKVPTIINNTDKYFFAEFKNNQKVFNELPKSMHILNKEFDASTFENSEVYFYDTTTISNSKLKNTVLYGYTVKLYDCEMEELNFYGGNGTFTLRNPKNLKKIAINDSAKIAIEDESLPTVESLIWPMSSSLPNLSTKLPNLKFAVLKSKETAGYLPEGTQTYYIEGGDERNIWTYLTDGAYNPVINASVEANGTDVVDITVPLSEFKATFIENDTSESIISNLGEYNISIDSAEHFNFPTSSSASISKIWVPTITVDKENDTVTFKTNFSKSNQLTNADYISVGVSHKLGPTEIAKKIVKVYPTVEQKTTFRIASEEVEEAPVEE